MNKNFTPEQAFTELAAGNAANPDAITQPVQPVIMLKRIGSTTYKVAVHFSSEEKETAEDKIARLIRYETAVNQ